MFNSIVVKQRSYRDQWFRICANLSVGKVMVCFHGVPFGRVLDGVGRILDCFLNLSSTIHVRKLSWPPNMQLWRQWNLAMCSCYGCLQQLPRRIVSQKGRFRWLDLRIIHLLTNAGLCLLGGRMWRHSSDSLMHAVSYENDLYLYHVMVWYRSCT